jgi:ketosteroid isomerase-like protein
MSQENGEIWRANLEALLAQLAAGTDPEATISTLAEIWDPQVELDATDATALDLNGIYRGADAARQFWQEWFSAWETLSFEYELVDAGQCVVMLVDMRMRGRSTGIEVPFGKFAWVSTFRDGLIVRAKLYMSQSEALEASGLRE